MVRSRIARKRAGSSCVGQRFAGTASGGAGCLRRRLDTIFTIKSSFSWIAASSSAGKMFGALCHGPALGCWLETPLLLAQAGGRSLKNCLGLLQIVDRTLHE